MRPVAAVRATYLVIATGRNVAARGRFPMPFNDGRLVTRTVRGSRHRCRDTVRLSVAAGTLYALLDGC
jgi:hypothetical protein